MLCDPPLPCRVLGFWQLTPSSTCTVELFGGAAVSCITEQAVKFACGRSRPPWTPVQSQWVVPAEWLSFPSGHALRAFHLCFLLADSELVGGALPGGAALTAPRLLLWAAAVGAARVLKGRHYPLDVVAGALLGVGLGVALESHSRRHAEDASLPFAVVDYSRSQQVKAFCGTLLALEWGLYYAVGLAARALAPAVLAILASMDDLWAASHARDVVKMGCFLDMSRCPSR